MMPLASMIKGVLSATERVLPRPLFRAAFDGTFATYRVALRIAYARRVLGAQIRRDEAARIKYSTILQVMPFSLVGTKGLEATYDAACSAEETRLEGSFVECGVAQGGAAALLGLVSERYGARRHLWLFDSFEGLPEPSEMDFIDGRTGTHIRELPPGSCLGTLQQVERLLFGRFELSRERISLVKGWFEKTLAPHRQRVGPVAVLRIDADWYESVKCCLANFYDQVAVGGFVVIDDYFSCFGAKRAVDEFLDSRGVSAQLVADGRGGAWFMKP